MQPSVALPAAGVGRHSVSFVYGIDRLQVAKRHRVAVLRALHRHAAGYAIIGWELDATKRPTCIRRKPERGREGFFTEDLGRRAVRDAQIAYLNMRAGKRPLDVIDLRTFAALGNKIIMPMVRPWKPSP